jgi:hypothetical protein
MKNIIATLFLIAFSGCLYHGVIKVTDKMPDPPQRLQTATMDRIDSLQGVSPLMKEHAMRRLKEMGTDSVEIIIKKAGF